MLKYLSASFCIFFTLSVFASDSCDKILVLQKTEELSSSAKALAKYKLIDKEMYEQIKSTKGGGGSGGIDIYGYFSADFDQSESYKDFKERRNRRLEEYRYSESENQSRDVLKQFLSESQVQAWELCMLNKSAGGLVLLTSSERSPSNRTAVLRTRVKLPTGVGQGLLNISMSGATINGEQSLSTNVLGDSSMSYIIAFNENVNDALIVANIAGVNGDFHAFLKEKEYVIDSQSRLSTTFDVCSGVEANCLGLPGTHTACHFFEITSIPSSSYVSAVDPVFTRGRIFVGEEKRFTLELSPHPNALSDPKAARFIKVCGSSANDKNWRQAVTVNVWHAPFRRSVFVDTRENMVSIFDETQQFWYDTGLSLKNGIAVEIKAEGNACWGADRSNCSGPDGFNVTCGEIVDGSFIQSGEPKCGALIAKVGAGTPIVVGSKRTITGRIGKLFLGYYDLGVDGNSGGYKVTCQLVSDK